MHKATSRRPEMTSKRPRYLLGLGFALGWHGALLEGFAVFPSFMIKFRGSARNPVISRTHHFSACPLLALKEDYGSGDSVRNDTARNMWEIKDNPAETAHQASDSKTDGIRGLSLIQLLDELDRRNIIYHPSASRSDLERLLHKAQKEHLSLNKLIVELDLRDIRYPPTASRRELEALLKSSKNPRTTPETGKANSKDRVPLAETLEALDERNNQYSPTESLADLEMLRREKKLRKRQSGAHKSQASNDPYSRSLQSIIKELDERNICYPPTATKADLEALLLTKPTQAPPDGSERRRRLPLEKLITELDRRNIRYSPAATRRELEELLQSTPVMAEEQRLQRRRQRQKIQETPIKSLFVKSTRIATKGVQRLPRKVSKIASSSGVSSRLSKAVERASWQARRMSRRASDLWTEDENGIREPDWHYTKVDTTIDVPAVRLDEDEHGLARQNWSKQPRQPPSRVRKPPFSEETWQSNARIPKRRRRKRPTFQNTQAYHSESPFILPPKSLDSDMFSDTPPESGTESKRKGAPDLPRPKSGPARGKPKRTKKIYSPYSQSGEDQDAFDRFGNLIVDTADRLFWGGADREGVPSQGKKQDKSEGGDRKLRYWKDRLAEQVDYALGIHEDGKYYNSWEKQLDREQREGNGTDYWHPFQSQKRQAPQSRGVKHRVPLWEEEGNLVSLLFGRRPSGGKLKIEVS